MVLKTDLNRPWDSQGLLHGLHCLFKGRRGNGARRGAPSAAHHICEVEPHEEWIAGAVLLRVAALDGRDALVKIESMAAGTAPACVHIAPNFRAHRRTG